MLKLESAANYRIHTNWLYHPKKWKDKKKLKGGHAFSFYFSGNLQIMICGYLIKHYHFFLLVQKHNYYALGNFTPRKYQIN